MSNGALISIYLPLAVLSAGLTLAPCFRKRRRLDGSIQFLAGMLFCWQALLVAYLASGSARVSLWLYDMNMPLVALTALAYFLFILRFYGLDRQFPRAAAAALFVIPAFTAIVSATSPLHGMMRSHLEILATRPVHVVSAERGPWFWVHAAYCYLLIVVALAITIVQHVRVPKPYRLPSWLLLTGIVVVAGGNVLVLARRFPFDASLVALSVATALLFFATLNNQGLDFFLQARREVFHQMDEAVLIFDDEGQMVSCNEAARERMEAEEYRAVICQALGLPPPEGPAPLLAEAFIDEEGGVDYHLSDRRIHNVRAKPILDNQKNVLGTFLIVADVTENRKLISYLEDVSGVDALTGLYNRRQLEETVRSLDVPENLPIAVLMGDVNNLKEVNDTLGHQQGDALLRVVAETMLAVCPPQARIARVGGDEFLAVLPGSDAAAARQLKKALKKALGEVKGHPFVPSMAIGYSVKELPQQDFLHTVDMADTNMYADKTRRRGAAP